MTNTPGHTPDALTRIRELEASFAAAMTQLYAVGNGLASLRHDVESRGAATPGATPSGATASAATASGTPPAAAATTPPVGETALPQRSSVTDPSVTEGTRAAEAAAALSPTTPRVEGPSTPLTPPGQPTPPPVPRQPQPSAHVPPVPPVPPEAGQVRPAYGPPPPGVPRPGAAQPTERWWERPGAVARVLGAAGAVITLFGIAFLLAIAIAAGIFGPVPRTISGALLAAALVAGGVVARGRSPEKAGGEALVATGLAAAYLDLLAATALYHFIPGAAGLVLGAILTVGAFLLAREWNSQLLAVLAAAPPALLAPAITGIGSVLTLSFVALLLVGSAFAHLGRTWPWLYIARIMPAVPVLVIGVIASRASDVTIIAMMTATALAMIAAGSTERSRQIALAPTTAAVLAAAPLLWAVILLRDDRLAITAALAALFLVVAAATASWTRNGGESAAVSASLWTAPLITGTVLVVIAAAELSPRSLIGLALAGASAAYLLVAAWRRSVAVANAGAVLAALSAFGFLEIVGSIGSLSLTAPRADGWAIGHGLALTAVAALGAYTVRALSTGAANPHLTRLAAGVMLVTISTTVVLTGTWLGSLQGEPRLGFYGGHATATALWTAAAGLLLTVFARRSRDRAFAVRTGLGLIAAAVVKLFLFDLSALGGLFRVLAFIASGVIVLVIGASYSRAPEGPRYGEVTPPGPPAPGPAAPGPVDHGPGAADPQQALRQPVPKSTPEETAPSPSPQQEPSDTASSRH